MFIAPMLLHYAEGNKPFNNDQYITELKLDGIRLIISNMNEFKIYTRHNNDVTANFKELINPNIPSGTILDGELVVLDEDGKPNFEKMMSRFHSNKSKHIVTFSTFDVIYHRGEPVKTDLMRRKELLDQLVTETEHYQKSKFIEGKAMEFFELCKQHELEGCVIKAKDSKYEIGVRSNQWQKVIAYDQDEVLITGFSKDKFGWLIGKLDNGRIRNVGVLELGVGEKERKAAFPLLRRMVTKENQKFAYVDPAIRVKVKYRNWTSNGMMRLPVFDEFVL
jgi:DNA ligase-1